MYFVFDTETVPDFDLVRQAIDKPSDDPAILLEQAAEQIAKNKAGFLPPMFHRMVSWVGIWVDPACNPRAKHAWSGHDEKEGLMRLMDVLAEYKDFGLVHHNGKGFDLPLIMYRCMKYSLPMTSRLSHRDIKYKFSDQNVDLVDAFSNFGASSWPKLKHLGSLIGIPFKQTGEGNHVLEMFEAGNLGAIEHYCYEDVLATYLVWLHYRHTSGEIDTERFRHLNERALQKLKEVQASAPQWPASPESSDIK